MQKYKKPTYTDKDIGTNPMSVGLVIPITKREIPHQFRTDKEKTELDEKIHLPAFRILEQTQFVHFYTDAERRKKRNQLSPQAKSLLLWIMDELDYNADHLWINKERYMQEVEITSINTYKGAIANLIKDAFIATTIIKDVYFINPNYFFKGRRITKYPDNVVLIK